MLHSMKTSRGNVWDSCNHPEEWENCVVRVIHDQNCGFKARFQKDTCTPKFTEALFTKAKTWKQPLSRRWIRKMLCIIYNGMSLGHRKEWNNAIWGNMEGPGDYQVNQTEKDKIPYDITHTRSLKYDTNECLCETERDSQDTKINSWLPKRRGTKGWECLHRKGKQGLSA